jgi:hypothetical protein
MPPSKRRTLASLHSDDAKRGRRLGPENAFVLVKVALGVLTIVKAPVVEVLSDSPCNSTGWRSWPQWPNEGPCKSSSASSSGLFKGKEEEEEEKGEEGDKGDDGDSDDNEEEEDDDDDERVYRSSALLAGRQISTRSKSPNARRPSPVYKNLAVISA